MKKRILAMVMSVAMLMSVVAMLSGCNKDQGGKKPDAFVIMTDSLDGLFNPFYSTSAADGTVVSTGDNSFGQCDVSGWSYRDAVYTARSLRNARST
jgi:hypothetical protein